MLTVVALLAEFVWLLWPWMGMMRGVARVFGREMPAVVGGVFFELRPFYIPASVYLVIYWTWRDGLHWLTVIDACISVVNWYTYRNDEDDRWKKRRRKLVEKISRVGSRLSVVPVGAGA